ncbi:hypothetical protein MMC10_003356 [Thelotrema lepadinum]|nr:hypothetical protein [Thelotrema lepadinum]
MTVGWSSGTLAAMLIAGQKYMSHAADTSGCKNTHAVGYHDSSQYASHNIVSGEITRNYTIYVPSTYNTTPIKQFPLILDYHGSSDTPDEQHDNSKYDSYTAGEEYLIVYPQGVDEHWQGPSYANPDVDDLQFTTDLLAHLRTEYCIDSTRVYASGKSNGGGFVDTLACSDNGDEFFAFAMASAALYTDTTESDCPKKRAILESHGDVDTTIPYHPTKNGAGGPLPDITEWVEWWGQRDGCDPVADRKETGDLGGYNVTSYSCDGLSDVVQHYQVFDLGHCWPSSTGDNFDGTRSYCQDHVLDYTPVVLDFFSKWNQSNAPIN